MESKSASEPSMLEQCDVLVRTMNIGDASSIHDIGRSRQDLAFCDWETPEVLRQAIGMNNGFPQVALEKKTNAIVGFVFAGHDGIRAGLHHLWVNPQFRGHGIAKVMIQRAIEAFLSAPLPVKRIRIASRKANCEAIEFWSKNGFTKTSGRGAHDQSIVSFYRDI